MNLSRLRILRSHSSQTFTFLSFLLLACGTVSAQRSTPAQSSKPKIRAITAFINLDRSIYQRQVADAFKTLKYARTVFESRGFEVQTIRLATQPFPEYTKGLTTEQTIAFFKDYDALMTKDGIAASIGTVMLNSTDNLDQAEVLGEILSNTKSLNGSVTVAGEDGVRWAAVGAAARIMKRLESTEHSHGNFNFSAIAMVPPLTPFFPGSYHTGFGHQFAVALQSADVVMAAFKGAPDLATARQRLIDKLGGEAFAVQAQAERIDQDTGWTYMGIDLSPAPLKDVSIGAALEELSSQPFGSSGTLTAAATVTAAIKSIMVKQAGYSGLMLPIMEDSRLAQRWSEGGVSLDALLSYSAVCGTGLDTVPLPGDVTEQKLELIIGDMASLAFKWHKPLSARLLPIAGKKAGDTTDFDDPYMVNTTLQPIDHQSTDRQSQ